ncbi:MAG: hypothetical protein ABI793_00840 [Flavobacterium sp.]
MTEKIIFTLHVITQDFFTAFGLFTILYLFLSIFIKKQILHQTDEEANKFISFIGILYLIIWIAGIIVEFNILNEEDKISMLNRIFGKYWFGFWIQPLLWVAITQLLRFKKIRKNILLRLFFSVLLMISIEKMVIISTSFHRDYLPSSWTMYNELDIYPSNLILSVLMKICMFLIFVGIFHFVNNRIKSLKFRKE